MQWKTRIWQLVLLAIIIAIVAIAFAPRATIVDVSVVKRGPLQETIVEEGKTRVIDRFIISAPVDGFVRRIDLNIGDRIDKSQAIVQLEPLRSQLLDTRDQAAAQARVQASRSALLAAEENVEAARADAVFAISELERLSALYENKAISLSDFQQAQANARRTAARLKSSEFAVQVAQFELEAAQTALRYSANNYDEIETEKVAIIAPVSGQVLKVYHESEGIVAAGEPLLEIGDPSSLEVEVDVLSQDAVKIQVGTPVNLYRWGGESTLQGRVRIIEPVGFTKISALGVEEQRVLVIVDLTSSLQERQRLGDGYRVEASFVLWESDNVLQIPTSALFRYQGKWAVFALKNNRAELQLVALGHRNGLFAEITAGLTENQSIITHPDDSIHDGKRVRLRQ